MYRVLITDNLIEDAKEYASHLPQHKIKKSLEKLRDGMRFANTTPISIQPFQDYIDKIIIEYPKL